MNHGSIAVTGGNGRLGREIVRDLSGLGSVTSIDIRPGAAGTSWRQADVLAQDQLRSALAGHDAIVHAAALLLPTDSTARMFEVNVVGTWNVLEVAAGLGIRKVVLISSECSSGIINISGIGNACPDYLPVDEDHPLRPSETYGLSKQLAEISAASYARRSAMQIVALRPTLVVMPEMAGYVATVRQKDDPDLWSYVELRDVVRAVRLALDYKGPPFDSFYLSARDTFSTEETLVFMKRRFGRLPEIRAPRLYEENPFAAIWDLTRSERLLNFRPESDWRRLLSDARTGSEREAQQHNRE